MYVHVKSVQGHGAEPPPCRNRENRKTVKTPVPRNQAGLRVQHHFFSARKKKGEEGELTIFSFETEIFFLSSDAK